MKKHNFSAGPSILPKDVIQKSAEGILNINGSNLSLIEISHRSKDFVEIMNNATSLALELLNLENKGYKALFLQGGASMQFLMTAYNLLENKAGYINTGAWSTKALKEAKNIEKRIRWSEAGKEKIKSLDLSCEKHAERIYNIYQELNNRT